MTKVPEGKSPEKGEPLLPSGRGVVNGAVGVFTSDHHLPVPEETVPTEPGPAPKKPNEGYRPGVGPKWPAGI